MFLTSIETVLSIAGSASFHLFASSSLEKESVFGGLPRGRGWGLPMVIHRMGFLSTLPSRDVVLFLLSILMGGMVSGFGFIVPGLTENTYVLSHEKTCINDIKCDFLFLGTSCISNCNQVNCFNITECH